MASLVSAPFYHTRVAYCVCSDVISRELWKCIQNGVYCNNKRRPKISASWSHFASRRVCHKQYVWLKGLHKRDNTSQWCLFWYFEILEHINIYSLFCMWIINWIFALCCNHITHKHRHFRQPSKHCNLLPSSFHIPTLLNRIKNALTIFIKKNIKIGDLDLSF